MRYAVYYAPEPSSAFHALGSQWLGRDAVTGVPLRSPEIAGISEATAEPRRYGFHATLKPPFTLREDGALGALTSAVAALAEGERPFRVRLKVDILDGFLALVPTDPIDALQNLAGRCVSALDSFRKPAGSEEVARRRAAGLSARQEENLQRWGYPYVFEDFRFHMTLSSPLAHDTQQRFMAAAEAHFAPVLADSVMIDGVALFYEEAPGAPFVSVRHFPFSNLPPEAAA